MQLLSRNICRIGIPLVFWTVFGVYPAIAQDTADDPSFPTADSIVRRIYMEGMHHSQVEALAQALMDSIGPRLTGSPADRAATDGLVRTYPAWGVPVHNEQYGTWRSWPRGPSRIELLTPRV